MLLTVAERPEQVLRVRTDREVRQSRILFAGRDEIYLVRVIVDLVASSRWRAKRCGG